MTAVGQLWVVEEINHNTCVLCVVVSKISDQNKFNA